MILFIPEWLIMMKVMNTGMMMELTVEMLLKMVKVDLLVSDEQLIATITLLMPWIK